MLHQILDAWNGTLPPDVKVVFANTGKERPETLDFVQRCSQRWNVPITWLEFRWQKDAGPSYEIVNHNSASRAGEPFDMLIESRSYLPNPMRRVCSIEMKIRTIYRWVRKELQWEYWDNVIGLRADEPRRVAKAKTRAESDKERFFAVMPLAAAGATVRDIMEFWAKQPFDLDLKSINGNTIAGNCDLCFMKTQSKLLSIIKNDPASADWWIKAEKNAVDAQGNKTGSRFRLDRPSYAEMREKALNQFDLFPDDAESSLDCACTD